MEARLPVFGGTVLALIALAVGVALGQPALNQSPDAGLIAAGGVIIECPPPPVQAGGSGPGC